MHVHQVLVKFKPHCALVCYANLIRIHVFILTTISYVYNIKE
jgi:hypothetical protein